MAPHPPSTCPLLIMSDELLTVTPRPCTPSGSAPFSIIFPSYSAIHPLQIAAVHFTICAFITWLLSQILNLSSNLKEGESLKIRICFLWKTRNDLNRLPIIYGSFIRCASGRINGVVNGSTFLLFETIKRAHSPLFFFSGQWSGMETSFDWRISLFARH